MFMNISHNLERVMDLIVAGYSVGQQMFIVYSSVTWIRENLISEFLQKAHTE